MEAIEPMSYPIATNGALYVLGSLQEYMQDLDELLDQIEEGESKVLLKDAHRDATQARSWLKSSIEQVRRAYELEI